MLQGLQNRLKVSCFAVNYVAVYELEHLSRSRPDLNALNRYELDCIPNDDGDPLFVDVPINKPIYLDDDDDDNDNNNLPGTTSRAGHNFQVLTDDVLGPHYTVKRIRSQ